LKTLFIYLQHLDAHAGACVRMRAQGLADKSLHKFKWWIQMH